MDTTLRFDRVHVLEWLRPGEIRTGWELFNELDPIATASQHPVTVRYWRTSTRAEVIGFLRSFAGDAREQGHSPILHIETHGDSYGIGLSETECLLWAEFMNELIALNEHTRLNLLVILAACEGIWGLQMVQPVERAAHRALIGPCRRVSSREVLTGSVTFYRTMFRDRSAVTAFRAMNDAIDPARKAFNVVTAEAAFQRVYTEYLRERCSERALAEREEAIVAGLGELTERARGSSAEELGRARRLVREHLRSHRHHFNQIRTKFFFIDLYPENDARFPLRFEDFGAAVDPPDTDAAPIDSA